MKEENKPESWVSILLEGAELIFEIFSLIVRGIIELVSFLCEFLGNC
jgi:hypothetical protein